MIVATEAALDVAGDAVEEAIAWVIRRMGEPDWEPGMRLIPVPEARYMTTLLTARGDLARARQDLRRLRLVDFRRDD